MRLRILPLTMLATGMLLAVKVADVARGGEEFARVFLISSVQAESEPAAGTPPAAPANFSAPAKEEEVMGLVDASKKGRADIANRTGMKIANREKQVLDPSKGGQTDISPKGDIDSGRGIAPGTRYFSPIELEILQTLGNRREQLMAWENDIEIKENLLSVTEKRVDAKLILIDGLKKEMQEMLATYDEQEDAKIRSLVKIYETMKPKDAARIFDEVEMPILLLVIDRMAEKKAAPILAGMDSKKAKQLTVELANQRRLQSAKLNSVKPAAPTAASGSGGAVAKPAAVPPAAPPAAPPPPPPPPPVTLDSPPVAGPVTPAAAPQAEPAPAAPEPPAAPESAAPTPPQEAPAAEKP